MSTLTGLNPKPKETGDVASAAQIQPRKRKFMPIKSIPSIANTQACTDADCPGCENCPDIVAAIRREHSRQVAAQLEERLTGMAERMEDSAARTAAFLELDLFPTEHPDAKAEREGIEQCQAAELRANKSIQSERKALLSKTNSETLPPDRIDYEPAKAPISTHCPVAGFSYGERVCVAGVAYRTPQPCGKDSCPNCTAFHRWKKLEQYGQGIIGHEQQTQLTIGALGDDNAAADARNYISNRFGSHGPKRFSQINRNETTGLWEVIFTFADVLRETDFDSPAKVGRLEICLIQKFIGCTVDLVTKSFPSFRLEANFYATKKTPSGHIASGFSQGWIQPRKPVDLYQYGEVEIREVADGMPAVRVDKHRCGTCEVIEKQHHEHPEEMAAAFADVVINEMVFDKEAMADLADALHSQNVDAGIFALLRTIPKDFPYQMRRLIMDTAQHVCRDADGNITLLPSARLAHVQVWRRAW